MFIVPATAMLRIFTLMTKIKQQYKIVLSPWTMGSAAAAYFAHFPPHVPFSNDNDRLLVDNLYTLNFVESDYPDQP